MKPGFLLTILVAAVIVTGCTQYQPATQSPATQVPDPTPAPAEDTVRQVSGPPGTFLTDSSGKTLYVYAKDTPGSGTSACTGGCASVWPAFHAPVVRVSSPLSPADFGQIIRSDGVSQTIYKGRPLYSYQPDTAPGDTRGEGFGGVWFVANVSGTLPPAPAPSPTAFHTLSPYGGGSY